MQASIAACGLTITFYAEKTSSEGQLRVWLLQRGQHSGIAEHPQAATQPQSLRVELALQSTMMQAVESLSCGVRAWRHCILLLCAVREHSTVSNRHSRAIC